jgi:serine/threonine-protein kinase
MERRANREDVIGRQVGRYTIVSHLATGGMAELYIARQEAVGGFEKNLVVKVLQSRYAQHPRVVAMFLDEARLAAKLNHPSIVHVYDVAEEDGNKFIAMEYIHGETLTDIIKRGVEVGTFLPMEHAVHIVSQVAAGLDYAHRRHDASGGLLRIVHRDVSPSNIMVSYEGQTKIIDFGIARVQDQIREESGMHPGKASYMSPEQVQGQAVDYRSDIFSLGIILYEITLARRLWRGAADEVMRRIVSEPAPPPSSIRKDYAPALEAIVMKALEKRPENRFQSAEEMRHDLEEFLAVGGFRSGARQTALYLRELFPIKAALSDEGVVQPKVPNDSDSAPLPIVLGGEGSPSIGAAGIGAVPTAPSGASRAAGGSPFPSGMTVLTQVSTKSGRRPEIESDPPLVIPRGPSNAKLALLAAAITFVAITGAILFLRSRKPDDAVASPAPPTNVEPGAAPAGEPAARPSEPATPPPPKAQAAQEPEARQPEHVAEATTLPPSDSQPPVMKVSTPPGASSSHTTHPVPKRELQRRQRRQIGPNDPSSTHETSRLNANTPSSAPAPTPPPAPVAEAPRPAPPPAPEPPPRPAAHPTPSSESAPAVVSRPAPSASPPGFIDSKAVTAVVRAHATEVQGCFDRALMEHSDLHGRLTVRASVDPNGHVLGVTPTAVMPGGGRLQACVVEAFAHWTFPPPSGGVKGTVTYSFTFE